MVYRWVEINRDAIIVYWENTIVSPSSPRYHRLMDIMEIYREQCVKYLALYNIAPPPPLNPHGMVVGGPTKMEDWDIFVDVWMNTKRKT